MYPMQLVRSTYDIYKYTNTPDNGPVACKLQVACHSRATLPSAAWLAVCMMSVAGHSHCQQGRRREFVRRLPLEMVQDSCVESKVASSAQQVLVASVTPACRVIKTSELFWPSTTRSAVHALAFEAKARLSGRCPRCNVA